MFILVCLVSFNFNRNNLLEKCTLSLNGLKRTLGYTVMSITRRLGPRCRLVSLAHRMIRLGRCWESEVTGGVLACSDKRLELFIGQLIDRHDLLELLGVTCLVLQEVRDSYVLHHSQALQALHVLVGHLQNVHVRVG